MNDRESSGSAAWYVLLIAAGVMFFLYIIACAISSGEPRSIPHLQLGMTLLSLFVGGLGALASLIMLIVSVALGGRQAAIAPWVAVLLASVTVAQPNWATAIGLAIVVAAMAISRASRASAAAKQGEPPVLGSR